MKDFSVMHWILVAIALFAAFRFNRKALKRGPGDNAPLEIEGDGRFSIDVVGESNYQSALELAAGGRSHEGSDHLCSALLVLEDENPHDKNAVRVDIDGHTVGYLNRTHAKVYRKVLRDAGRPKANGRVQARILGGWVRRGSTGQFGVKLDM